MCIRDRSDALRQDAKSLDRWHAAFVKAPQTTPVLVAIVPVKARPQSRPVVPAHAKSDCPHPVIPPATSPLAVQVRATWQDRTGPVSYTHLDVYKRQQFYFYENNQGMFVKKGTQLKLTCVYDNPTSSAVTWGESTTDEMCLNYFYTTGP